MAWSIIKVTRLAVWFFIMLSKTRVVLLGIGREAPEVPKPNRALPRKRKRAASRRTQPLFAGP